MNDYISRQAAIDALNNAVCDECVCRCAKPYSKDCYAIDKYSAGIRIIKKLPSAQPERKKGKWKDDGMHGDFAWEIDGHGRCWHEWICSECGDWNKSVTNFCPNCGADMRERRTDGVDC